MKVHVIVSVWTVLMLSVSGLRDGGLRYSDYQFIDNKLTSYEKNTEPEPRRTKPSLSCLLFGNIGCQCTCDVMCGLYGCTSNANCRNMMYCECNEVYNFQNREVPAESFKSLSFDELWNYKFAKSAASTKLRDKIKNNPQMREFVLELLQNPHTTGDDIKASLIEQYPGMSELKELQSIRRGAKEDIAGGGDLEYDNLGQYFGDLFRRLKERVRNAAYRKRLMRVLKNIDSKDELEYIQKQILMSGNESLYHFVNSFLRRRGIDFEDNSKEFMSRVCRRRQRRPNRRCKRKRGRFQDNFDSDCEQDLFGPSKGKTIKKKVILKSGSQPLEVDTDEDEVIELTVINQLVNSADGTTEQNQSLNAGLDVDANVQPTVDVTPASKPTSVSFGQTQGQQLSSPPNTLPQLDNTRNQLPYMSTSNSWQTQLPSTLMPDTWQSKLPKLNNWQTNISNNLPYTSKLNDVQSNTPTIPTSLLENFPTMAAPNIPQPTDLHNKLFSGPVLEDLANRSGRFPGIGNFGDSIRQNIEEKMNQQKKLMKEVEEKAAKDEGDGKTHATYTHNSVSNNVVVNDIDGKRTQFETSVVENVNKDSDRPETNTDQSFKMNAVSVKDDSKDVDGKVMQTLSQDNLKGTSVVKGASNGYLITEDNGATSSSQLVAGAPKSTTFTAPGINNVYHMVQDVANSGANSQSSMSSQMSNQQEHTGSNDSSVYSYLLVDEDGNVVDPTNEELDIHPEHLSQLMNSIPASFKNNVGSTSFGRINTNEK